MKNNKSISIKNDWGDERIISVISSRTINVTGSSPEIKEIKNDKGEVTYVKYSGGPEYTVGDCIIFDNTRFKVNYISKIIFNRDEKGNPQDGDIKSYNLSLCKLSRSTYFILPLLADPKETVRDYIIEDLFLNCFIYKEGSDDKYRIYLLYRYSDSISSLEERFQDNSWFVKCHNVDKYNLLYEFKVQKDCRGEYDKFVKGQYSKFDQDYKEHLLKFHSMFDEKGDRFPNPYVRDIIEKSISRKKRLEKEFGIEIPEEQEYEDIPYEKEETYYDKFKILNAMDTIKENKE